MTKVISVFNNKGGVGKTTMVWNIADSLARRDKRVLMVDFDPQCNLSIAVLGSERFTETLPTENIPYGKTLRAYLQRFLQSTGDFEFFSHVGKATHSGAELLAGDFWLNVYAEQLNLGSDLLTGTGIAKYLVLTKLLEDANRAGHKPFDFAIIDLPPSFGSLVRAALYSSDYYLVPCTSDTFSAYCVGLIGQMFPRFLDDWKVGLERFKDANRHFQRYDTYGRPKFAGWIFNGYDVRSKTINRADQVHQEKIRKAVKEHILENEKLDHVGSLPDDGQIGGIEDMNVLVQNSIWQSVPISQLADHKPIRGLTGTGGWAGNQVSQIHALGKEFDKIADRILSMCSAS